jgi:hypothetical protein
MTEARRSLLATTLGFLALSPAPAAPPYPRLVIRIIGWCCIVLGVVVAALSPWYADYQSRANATAWRDSESHKANLDSAAGNHALAVRRLERVITMMKQGYVPSDTIATPWPVICVGAAISAFGLLLLGVRRRT